MLSLLWARWPQKFPASGEEMLKGQQRLKLHVFMRIRSFYLRSTFMPTTKKDKSVDVTHFLTKNWRHT